MRDIRSLTEITPGDAPQVGGKGLSLGLLAQAGLPVPPAVCITTDAHRRYRGVEPPAEFRRSVVDAYHRLGGGLVAVRSSATAEDGAAASFAGQQQTYLGVQGDDAIIDAVLGCWSSLDSERARAYREKQGIADMLMAVIVQRLVPAEFSGVLFTRDPNDPQNHRMLVEASWGLGESIVSGRVTPDRFVLDFDSGEILDKHLGDKQVERTAVGETEVAPERRSVFCIDDGRLTLLADLGRRVERYFGEPRDIEWAWADGQLWLLQARPITTGGLAERAQARRQEIAALHARTAPGGTIWVRFNLSEVLPEPTPMTWSIVRRFLSGQGGYGRMFADLGFPPDPDLDDESIYDLVGGRPYMNLSREPRMQWGTLPFGHPIAELRKEPARAPYSSANFLAHEASFGQKLRALWRLVRGGWSFQNQARTFADKFRTKIIPQFLADVRAAENEDWSRISPLELLTTLNTWIERTLIRFARESLKPTAFAASSMASVTRLLSKPLGADRARQAIGELTVGVRPDPDADLATALGDLARGAMPRATFLDKFGHRGSQEMELAEPRWREDPARLDRLVAGAGIAPAAIADMAIEAFERVAAEAKLNPTQRAILRQEVNRLKTFVALRETGKHHLLRGYALIRKALLEIDRQWGLNDGVFFLGLDDLPRVFQGESSAETIARNRRRRAVALSLEVPSVVFSDDLEAIGRPMPPPADAQTVHGVPLSPGVAQAPALVLTTPSDAVPEMESFVLVCPSTDPSWVPLFTRAKGLVMETGGVLSHGAIVAREFGLPAVAGLSGFLRRVHTGQIIRVDGTSGVVSLPMDCRE